MESHKKDRLVYSDDKAVDREEEINLDLISQKIAEAQRKHKPEAYRKILIAIGKDPSSISFKKRMASFYRACNLEIPEDLEHLDEIT